MTEITIFGRGGQGAVTSAELMAISAIKQGKFAQAFPSFGPERRGAPVKAFARIDDKYIRTRENIYLCDIMIVLDYKLAKTFDIKAELKPGGIIIVNTHLSEKEMRELLRNYDGKLAIINATKIAIEELGVPIVNTTMLGAFIKVTGLIDKALMEEALKERFGKRAEQNIKAFNRAMEEVKIYN